MQIIAAVSFLNPPGEELGTNHRARAETRVVVGVIFFLMQTVIMSKFAERQHLKTLIVFSNLLIMWFMVILQ